MAHNLAKSWLIFNILSLFNLAYIFRQNSYGISRQTLKVLPTYVGKRQLSKTIAFFSVTLLENDEFDNEGNDISNSVDFGTTTRKGCSECPEIEKRTR